VKWIDVFIKRPILTWMVTLSLVVFGGLGYAKLGVDQFPKMDFPIVRVLSHLDGASPEVIEEDVTNVLEEHLNTISGVRQLRSTSRTSISMITVEFELGVDIDIAAQDVRDKVARARDELPRELDPPVVDKVNPTGFPIMWVPLMTDRPQVEASEFVKHNVKPKVETVEGVAGIQIFGERDRAIRIWVDGEALRARGLAATDLISALHREHVEIPGGLIESGIMEYAVKTDAEYRSVDELARMVVAYKDGAPVLLRDVARVQDGADDLRYFSRYDGQPAVGIGVIKQSDANTVAIADQILHRISVMQKQLPRDMHFKQGEGVADFSRAIRESVSEAIFSLQFGAVLAVLTVFVFLRRWRPTMIVALAIPLSLVATFGVMWLLGYTLNTMTILAMTLAVGVVIDDAIVVLENIERHRENGEAPMQAAANGAKEISFAATAATLSIAAVFVPVIFVEGMVGNFLSEFGATVASAVLISLVVALTLTPMLAARIPNARERAHGSIYQRLEQGLHWLEEGYRQLLGWTVAHRLLTLGVAALSFGVAIFMWQNLGKEFFPKSDESRFFVSVTTPPGTNPEGTLEMIKADEKWALAQPEVAGIFSGAGFAGESGGSDPTAGIMFVMLKSRKERKRDVHEIIDEGRKVLGEIPGQTIRISDLSGMMTSNEGEFSVELEGNVELATLNELSDRFLHALEARGGFVDLKKSLRLGRPEIRVIPDREKAAALGLDAAELASTVQAMIGGLTVGTFKQAGNRYDIRMRLDKKDRQDPAAIERLYARTRSGKVVELRNLVHIEKAAAPAEITRVDRQRSVEISGNLQGKSLGEAIKEARAIAAEILPESVTLQLSGQAEQMARGMKDFSFSMLLAILVIYMILAAQFESLVHPLTVMLALPLAMVGALGGLELMGMTLNLFSMIGIILLFGLVTKNSILLVDYANQLRREGMEKTQAMLTAAPIRMRPVLMTALSMILGVAPAALGLGPGSETRAPMAVATGAGMLSSTALTLIVVPVFYLTLDDLVEGVKCRLRRKPAQPGAVATPSEA